jgi:hypothetical protein
MSNHAQVQLLQHQQLDQALEDTFSIAIHEIHCARLIVVQATFIYMHFSTFLNDLEWANITWCEFALDSKSSNSFHG